MGLKLKEPFQFLLEKWTDLQFPSELVSTKKEQCWPHSFWGAYFLFLNPSVPSLPFVWLLSELSRGMSSSSYELLLLLRVIFLIRVPGLKQAQRGASGWTQGAQQHRPCCWWSLGTSAALTARPELGDVVCRVGDPWPWEPAACPLRWAGRPPVPVRENSAGSQELVTAALLMTSLWFWATPSALFESAPLSVKRG